MNRIFAAAVALTLGSSIQARAADVNVLWYNGVSDGFANAEDTLVTPGSGDPSTATWSITHWYDGQAKPAGDFNVLVIGSYSSYGSSSLLNNLPTFGNRIMVTGQDADYHITNFPGLGSFDGPRGFLRDAVNWAAAGTGLGVIVLSPGEGAIPLSELGISGISNDVGGTNSVVIPSAYAAFPINTSLTTAGLSNWSTSAHDVWTTISSDWLGINTNGGAGYVTLVSANSAAGAIVGVAEPASMILLGAGLFGYSLLRRRSAA